MTVIDVQIELLQGRLVELRAERRNLKEMRRAAKPKKYYGERAKRALTLRWRGLAYGEIGAAMAVSTSRARELAQKGLRLRRRRKMVPVIHGAVGETWEARNCERFCAVRHWHDYWYSTTFIGDGNP